MNPGPKVARRGLGGFGVFSEFSEFRVEGFRVLGFFGVSDFWVSELRSGLFQCPAGRHQGAGVPLAPQSPKCVRSRSLS